MSAGIPRIDLSRVQNKLPRLYSDGGPRLYPFMISKGWIKNNEEAFQSIGEEDCYPENPAWYLPSTNRGASDDKQSSQEDDEGNKGDKEDGGE